MVKVGLVGAGFMGQMHAACYASCPNAELIAVADIRKENAKEVAGKHGAKAFKSASTLFRNDDIDIIDICLPTYMHAKFAVRAMKAGKNVVCEKPMALKLPDAKRMVKAAQEMGVKFMVAHVIRFWPEYMVLKDIYDQGTLGKLVALSLSRVSPNPDWAWERWLNKAPLSGAALVDLHVHDADFVRYLLGEPLGLDCTGTKNEGGWDYVFTNYYYPNMAVCAEGGWNMPGDFPFSMGYRAVFEKGTLDFSTSHSPTLALYPAEGGVKHPELPTPDVPAADTGGNISDLGGYFNEVKYFVDCVEKGQHPSVVTPEDACASVALIAQEIKSAQKKLKKFGGEA